MLNQVRFSCTALKGSGKQGILTPDKDGYYTVPLGALNVYNSAMEYYPYEEAKMLFERSSLLMRRVEKGVLKAELGHPKMDGMDARAFVQRCSKIYEQLVCAHYAEIFLDHESMRGPDGKPIVAVMGKARGSGPFANCFTDAMANRLENTCFSIRSFTDDFIQNGRVQKIIKEIVTWDMVNEPGIAMATKYNAPTLEEHSFIVQKNVLDSVVARTPTGMGMESDSFDFSSLYRLMGWEHMSAKKSFVQSW